VHQFLSELRTKLDEHADLIAIGETFDGTAELAASYCEQLHMAFNFELLEQPWRADRFQKAIARWDALLVREDTWPSYVLSNHDNPRHATRFALNMSAHERDARAKVAAALLMTLRGTPFIYYGEEIGMADSDVPAHERHDIGFGRDGARTPMQWSDGPHAGFSSKRPWLPIASDYENRNVARQTHDPRSVLALYRELIWLRNESDALKVGSWTPLLEAPRDAMAYLRRAKSQTMLVVLNFTDRTRRLNLGNDLPTRQWVPRVTTRRTDIGWELLIARDVVVGPYEATIFEAVGSAP
jgi:alpha-glucosidase